MVRQIGTAPELSALLDGYREQIAINWADMVREMGGPRYGEMPRSELTAAASRWLDAISSVLTSGSYVALDDYLADISAARLGQHFDIGEVVEGLLLLRESAIPFLWRSFSPGSLHGYEALARLDGCVRYMIGRFSHLYAGAMQADLERQQELTMRRLAESEAIQRVTTALLQKLELEDVLDIVCVEAQHLTGAEGSCVFLLEGDGSLRPAFKSGRTPSALDSIPLSGTMIDSVVRDGQRFLSNDLDRNGWTEKIGNGDLVSLLIVPLKANGTIIGALGVLNKQGGFTEEDARVAGFLADQAAIAIEHARLHRQAEQVVVMEERQRLARELHDSVTQSIYSVTLFAQAAAGLLAEGKQERALDRLRQLQETSQEALREMRLLIFELHPVGLEKNGLVTALQARLDAVENRGGLKASLVVEGSGRLPLAIEEELYRIAQEALNNVLKHARAGRVVLRLTLPGETTSLEVSDDGVGFDPEDLPTTGGLGLKGMRERAERLGATLELDSTPGQGTRVRVTLGKARGRS